MSAVAGTQGRRTNMNDQPDKTGEKARPEAHAPRFGTADGEGQWVNDVHAQLNRTHVRALCQPSTPAAVQRLVRRAAKEGAAISIAGGRHAMGGQQFGSDTVLIDTTRLDRLVAFDPEEGTVTVEAGIGWPKLIPEVIALQEGAPLQWGIRQKQTGADRLSLGGALAANASRGQTNVFVNGRNLPQSEVMVLSALWGTYIQPGRYWLDGTGNVGYEGVPIPVGNLYALVQAQGGMGGGGGDNFWNSRFSAGNYNADNTQGYVSVPGYGPVGYGFD